MKKLAIGIMAFALTMSVTSCKEGKETEKPTDEKEKSYEEGMDQDSHDHDETTLMVDKKVIVTMSAKSGSEVSGEITFVQGKEEVKMYVELNGLKEGAHAIHIHQNGDCSSDDGKSAGGHWDPTMEDHGKWGENMHHSGDIGNLEVAADGKAKLEFSTDKWCIGCDDEKRNILGKGVIVHASADDFKSQPSGAAGAREACGVIE
ncbi:MAG: Cu-Zn family superoxide dismutase [Nonlabens sp.]|jgi:Cu-Zn family superoxide dismutase|uniref:superoxide dismutase family protein n=1 Tax=Nonlabens sp. TaxID=1888209 RepID=UPI0039E3C2CF